MEFGIEKRLFFRNAIGEYQRSSNAANISFDSELGSAHGGCLQTTPKIFRFSKSKSKQNINHKFRHPPQYEQSKSFPLREKPSENIPIANDVTTNGDLQFQTQQHSLEKSADNTNLAFIADEACKEISTNYETNDQIARKTNLDNAGDAGDGYYTTEEVDVDEELNNSLEILESHNSSNTENFPNSIETQQNSFISRKMFSNFQNSGKSHSNKNKKYNKGSIFSFKIKKSPKRSDAKGHKGLNNPLAVTDELAPPSIVISPPTPSPKMSPVCPSNSVPHEQERQPLPSSPVKEETKVTKKDRKKEPSQGKQPIHRISKKNNSASISSEKTGKRTETKNSKSEGKSKADITLNEDTIYHFRDADDDDPSDVVILAEADISPTEIYKQAEKKNNSDKNGTPAKRSMENEIDNRPSKKKEKSNKSSNVFKMFNNNRRESEKEKRNKKIKHSQDASDDYLMTEEAIKDSYINESIGNKNTTVADPNDSSEESPPLNNFKNLKSNPDLAGEKFTSEYQVKITLTFRNEIQEFARNEEAQGQT